MAAQRYDPQAAETRLWNAWQETGTYRFAGDDSRPVYSIDTPPPTASGHLHLGHLYSYSHADFIARFRRMSGYDVYYPMGFDDNGLPTERLVEKWRGITAQTVGRKAFVEQCLEIGAEVEEEYRAIFSRLGLSVDWRHTYRTIEDRSQKISQLSFIDLYRKGLAYRRKAPTIWCPTCQTAIAQAEENDLEEQSEFVTIAFQLESDGTVPIATTRPELLPACVAIFVHPEDARYAGIVGQEAIVPLFGQRVSVMADPLADPEKGSGAVMCCTFGDAADVEWWYKYDLPLREAIGKDGRMTAVAGPFAGLTTSEARTRIVEALDAESLILGRQPTTHSIRVHERDDTPVEYIVTQQWFIRVLDHKARLIEAGETVAWHPPHMKTRYREWVENLHWDWALSRQRTFGVHIPLWYCNDCGEIILAEESDLPVNPLEQSPTGRCSCGSSDATPEPDVMDTWATSSMSPQIAGGWLTDGALYRRVFPMSLRPQAHDIIRTWAFYTIVKSKYQFDAVPWHDALISGWGLAGPGSEKISKSRGGGPMSPMDLLNRYSADAVRYWAASTGPGKDAVISEEKIQAGGKLATKLWNVAGFSRRFLEQYSPPVEPPTLSTADRWILSRLQRIVQGATDALLACDYATAKNDTESFFWRDLADNYLEMVKQRLYDDRGEGHEAAQYTLYHLLLTTLKLFAPFMPFITEELYQAFAPIEGFDSIHRSPWPSADEALIDAAAEAAGEALIEVATAVRRYKSDRNLSLGAPLDRLQIAAQEPALAEALEGAEADISSITRAKRVEVRTSLTQDLEALPADGRVAVGVAREG